MAILDSHVLIFFFLLLFHFTNFVIKFFNLGTNKVVVYEAVYFLEVRRKRFLFCCHCSDSMERKSSLIPFLPGLIFCKW